MRQEPVLAMTDNVVMLWYYLAVRIQGSPMLWSGGCDDTRRTFDQGDGVSKYFTFNPKFENSIACDYDGKDCQHQTAIPCNNADSCYD
jgi:hypothetical protein